MKFTELGLKDQLLEALDYMGFTDATPIQEKAIPVILENKDLIACAQTGTGKTGAFVMPVLNKLIGKEDTSINALIIVPTRELAIQIEQQIQGLSYFISVGSMAIYGGGDAKNFNEQKDVLVNGTDIIVATPGKLLSHLKLGYVNFDKVQHLILDEADRMLDMGFIGDIRQIRSYLPKNIQTLMFSATMPKSIKQLAQHILNEPAEISLSISKPAAGVSQNAYLVFDEQKTPTLIDIIKKREDYDSIIVFSSSKNNVSNIVRALRKKDLNAKGISSNLDQEERELVLRGFRAKQIRILVATDVMSRGIDVKEVNMVVNFDVPSDAEDYVHRIGRTARANTKGEAFTLVNPKDMHKLRKIERLIEMSVPKLAPPEELGKGPEWREDRPKGNRNHNKNKNKNFKGKKKYYSKNKAKNFKSKKKGTNQNQNQKKDS
ncbi:MAG: DEAD/DEAH box helicase [Crocinitomicaceae bacterium]|nr:DEAD/DEAH box helicase [Crocinitomicaceae bacterium]